MNRLSTFSGTLVSPNRIAAIIVWGIGALTTSKALGEMGMDQRNVVIAAVVLQFIFTLCEIPIWRRSRWKFVGIVVLFIDVWFNFGGTWFLTSNIDQTTAWNDSMSAFSSAFSTVKDAAGVSAGGSAAALAPAISKLFFGIIVSAAISAAPEWLWHESH